MKSYSISYTCVKKSLLVPLEKLIVLYVTMSPFLLFFAARPKTVKIFILSWTLGNLIMIPSILLGWFIGNHINNRKIQKITDEINLALKNGEIIKKVKVLPGNFFLKIGLSNKRTSIELTSGRKVSVVCSHKADESFEAILWKISPSHTLILSQETYIAIPI